MDDLFSELFAAVPSADVPAAGHCDGVPALIGECFEGIPQLHTSARPLFPQPPSLPQPVLSARGHNGPAMHMVSTIKKLKSVVKGVAGAKKFHVMGKLCDKKRGLRHGDRYNLGVQNRKRSRRPTPWLHPNTNYLDNTIVKAFEQIGGGPAKRSRFKQGEVGEQHGGSGMRSLSVSSAIWSEGQRMAIDDELVKSAKEGKTRTVYVANGYDSTPYTFRFGSLASQLLPHARFFSSEHGHAEVAPGEARGI